MKAVKNIIVLAAVLIFALAPLSADVVDYYELSTPTTQSAFSHKEGWKPIPRKIDTENPVTVLFYAQFYRGLIGTFDTHLYPKIFLTLTEQAQELTVKSIRVHGEWGWRYYNIKVNKTFLVPALSDENLLYNEDGSVFEVDGKPLYLFRFDLDKKVSGRKAFGYLNRRVKVVVVYSIDGEDFTAELEYICHPHIFTPVDFITLFALP